MNHQATRRDTERRRPSSAHGERARPKRHLLADITGGLRRPLPPEFAHLLTEDGRLDRTEQLRIMEKLLPPANRRSTVRFMFMLTLSVTIAVMGLAADSVAVVIGAMLIAPLMTPIMAFAASTGLGLGRRAAQSSFLVVVGTVWSIAFAALLARLLPDVTIGTEVLARTRPDVKDLVVAIAAGAAGAFAVAREDVSAALPGVAVAVALVPPLAVTGVLIEANDRVLAEGSALLYLTNLLAIIVSALAVFLLTGVIPTIRLCFKSSRISMAVAGIIVATVAIAVPLTSRTLSAASSSRQRTEISTHVDEWIGELDLDVRAVSVVGQTVAVEVAGLDEPPPAYELAVALVPVLGAEAEAVVQWDQRAEGTARADTPPAVDPAIVARGVLQRWVAVQAETGLRFELLDVTVSEDRVDAEVTGPIAPPRSPMLPDEVAGALGRPVELTLRWIQEFDPGLQGEAPTARLARYVEAWIGPRSGVRLVGATIEGGDVTIDLGTAGTPLGLDALRATIAEGLDEVRRVEIRTVPLVVVEPGGDVYAPPELD